MAVTVIPGYAEALARETSVRERAYLPGAPLTLGPFPVVELCPWHLVLFEQIASPILNPGIREPEVRDLIDALWILSPGFVPGNAIGTRFRRWRLGRRIAAHVRWYGAAEIMEAFYDHVSDAFIDQLGGTDGPARVRYTSWVADTVDILASQYGWTDEQILRTPMIRLNQYMKRIQVRMEGSKAILFNRSDQVKADWLAKVNADRVKP